MRICCLGISFGLISVVSLVASSIQSVAQQSAPTLWEHNGSIVYLVANGSERSFYYQEPRPGIAEQGVRTDTLLFRGAARGLTYQGTAFIFRRGCGSFPYEVVGSIFDNYQRVIMEGRAPRVSANCTVVGHFNDRLVFNFLNRNSSSTLGQTVFQALWTDSKDCQSNVSVSISNGEISFWKRFLRNGHRGNERYGTCDIRYVKSISSTEASVDYINCDHPGHVKNNVVVRFGGNTLEVPQGTLFRCQ